jgi:preprotein translocase subunit SecD
LASLIKDIRLLVLVIMVLISLLSLSRIFYQRSWLEVSFINESASCQNVKLGDKITQIGGKLIYTLEDFREVLENVKKDDFIPIVSNNQPASCKAIDDRNIGFSLKEVKTKVLNFGIDIEGGTRVLLRIISYTNTTETQEIVKILTERLNTYGLSDIKVLPVAQDLIQIEASGLTEDDIRNFLVKQGYFEGKVLDTITLTNGKGTLVFNGTEITFEVNNNTITIQNKTFNLTDGFNLNGIKYDVLNVSEDQIVIAANIFTAKDIENIFTDVQRNYVVKYGNGYRFVFTIQISKESAERFAIVTKGQPTYYSGGQLYIKPKLVLYLDKKPITELNIVSNIAGEAITTPSIEGFRNTLEEANLEKLRLQSILKSGSLPVELKIERVETITQTEGKKLFESTIYIIAANLIAVLALSFIRYRSLKISAYILMVAVCELILILGVASSQIIGAIIIVLSIVLAIIYKEAKSLIRILTIFIAILISGFVVIGKWTIDIPSIVGLISIIGNSAELITLTDQFVLERKRRIEENIETGMTIVYNSSTLLVFAMLPLAFLGLGSLKGFAITTTVGTLIDLFITRPAYMKLIEKEFLKKKEETV